MKETSPRQALLEHLASFVHDDGSPKDRGSLAELRRSINDPIKAYPFVSRFANNDWDLEAFSTLAGLYALHPSSKSKLESGASLGSALKLVQSRTNSDGIENRFKALLESHPEDLHHHLRRVIPLIRRESVSLKWSDILGALTFRDNEQVKRRWARDFWS